MWSASTCGIRMCRSGYGSVISQVLVSPWMHQVHHSRETRHLDMNMGFIFSFWDRLFGTLYVPKKDEPDLRSASPPASTCTSTACSRCTSGPSPISRRRWLKPAKTA
jgi:hypothetical protein